MQEAHAEDVRQVPARMREQRPRKGGGPANQVLITRVGLRFPGAVAYDIWERAGKHVSQIVDSSAWCMGDWIVYGQSNYEDRYRRAVEAAGLDYQTLRNYAWVARRFELSRRRDTLSFQHHAEVASLPPDEQDRWLTRAEQLRWSRNTLRQEIRRSRRSQEPEPRPSTLPRIPLEAEQVDRWRAAAERENLSLESWIVAGLDLLAGGALDDRALVATGHRS